MSDSGTPFHFGGPLGLGALAVMAGAAGVFLFANPAQDNTATPVAQHTPEPEHAISEEMAETVITAPSTPIESPSDAVGIKPASKKTDDEPAAKKILKSVKTPSLPAMKPKAAKRPAEITLAQAKGTEVTFIVRIKGSSDIDTAARLFKKDPKAALDAYAKYADGAPALKDFTLVGGSYSGEIKLAYTLPPGKDASRETINKLKQTIMSVDGVSYADPDFVAHPGKE